MEKRRSRAHRVERNSQISRDIISIARGKKSGDRIRAAKARYQMMKRTVSAQRDYITIPLGRPLRRLLANVIRLRSGQIGRTFLSPRNNSPPAIPPEARGRRRIRGSR